MRWRPIPPAAPDVLHPPLNAILAFRIDLAAAQPGAHDNPWWSALIDLRGTGQAGQDTPNQGTRSLNGLVADLPAVPDGAEIVIATQPSLFSSDLPAGDRERLFFAPFFGAMVIMPLHMGR